MRRILPVMLGLAMAVSPPARAATFARQPIAPDLGVDAFTRGVARALAGRDLFSNPWATVTISNVDVYDRFPYVETRQFEVVSDPQWNRLVYGALGDGLRAYDGAGTALGALSQPHGLAVDAQNRVYVADTGHDRIVVLQATTEFGAIALAPVDAVEGVSAPYGVAFSDGGTPFQAGDDYLFVAETGRNRVVAFAVDGTGAHRTSVLGDLGSGTGAFAGPMAIAVGRANGAQTPDVYVADAHNQRIVHLWNDQGRLRWVGAAPVGAGVVTALDTDAWGNVYAAAPQSGMVRKFTPALQPIADLGGAMVRPRGFHVPFANVSDHRDGTLSRVAQPNAIAVDAWTDQGGVSLWRLGAGIDGLVVDGGAAPSARFTLTDRAAVTLEIDDPGDGRMVSRRALGILDAGAHAVPLGADDWRGVPGATDLVVRLAATSSYPGGETEVARASFRAGDLASMPTAPGALVSWPNPVRFAARIAFVLPASGATAGGLDVIDASGRRVRHLGSDFAPGAHLVDWSANDDAGRPVRPGRYFLRLRAGELRVDRAVVVVR